MVFAVLVALALEYFSPRPYPSPVNGPLVRYGDWVLGRLNAGTRKNGWFGWALAVLLPALAVGIVGLVLSDIAFLLGWVWAVAVLYICMGYRLLADRCLTVAKALSAGDLTRARIEVAGCWTGTTGALSETEVASVAIESLLRKALTRLFGVLCWFVLLGPFGAVLYFLTHQMRGRWAEAEEFVQPLETVVFVLDWLPARALAVSFAVVGNFESALVSWKDQAYRWLDRNEGAVLAAGAGALGIRLGGALTLPSAELLRPELGLGDAPGPDFIRGAMHLVVRVILLWLVALLIYWLGWAAG